MAHILIHTDHPAFETAITRTEPAPHGISLIRMEGVDSEAAVWMVHVNLRMVSGTAFALWILRKIRSVAGSHRIEIGGRAMPTHMPEAIDVIADAVVNRMRSAVA